MLLALLAGVVAEECSVGDATDLSLFRSLIEVDPKDFACALEFVREAKAETISAVKAEYDMLQRKLNSKLNDLKAAIEKATPIREKESIAYT